MRKLLAALTATLALALTACAHTPPPTQYVPCRVTQVPRPIFPFDRLNQGADIHTQVKTLLADREERKGYEVKLEAANRGCP
ncbi:hypothetical protein [Caulobacter vibrioides]|uniref:Lipoprotein n=1 Tax=Caulobacter phage S2B TaxID=2759120 RepID=A0AAE7SYK7_9CAUD|nr:hypothetical protein [Caulobacter vibrioides]QOC54148.1 hypothetical protein [Caulobacter phage S2B]QXZ50178.1 hypothetical protein KZH45_09605 [Caulobacter vibrioides]